MSLSTIRVSGSTLSNIQNGMDIVSNNVANINSIGFHEKIARFENITSHNADGSSYSGSYVNAVNTNNSQGRVEITQNQANMAIHGKGYFVVQDISGKNSFTRAGDFKLDRNRDLVDNSGRYVLGTSGSKISIPTDAYIYNIQENGDLYVSIDEKTIYYLDTVQMAMFQNEEGLISTGGGLYQESASSGQAIYSAPGDEGSLTQRSRILPGQIEMSNVDISKSLTDMITLQRSYQAMSRVTTTANEMLDTTLALAR